MTKRILFLKGAKPNDKSGAYELSQLMDGIIESDVVVAAYADLTFTMNLVMQDITLPGGESITGFDAVYLRDFRDFEYERSACALLLRKSTTPFINSDTANFQHMSKLTQYFALSIAGVDVPSSVFGSLSVVEDKVVSDFGFPFIAKSISARNGNDNYLIRNKQELDGLREQIDDGKFVFQEFIENDKDYRVIVIGDKVGEVYERKRQEGSNSHVNNASAGGAVRVADGYDPVVKETALKAANAIGREIAGVDVMVSLDGRRTVVLEVNDNYQVQGFMDKNSADVKALAEYLDRLSSQTS